MEEEDQAVLLKAAIEIDVAEEPEENRTTQQQVLGEWCTILKKKKKKKKKKIEDIRGVAFIFNSLRGFLCIVFIKKMAPTLKNSF
jgi:hypothetical protein